VVSTFVFGMNLLGARVPFDIMRIAESPDFGTFCATSATGCKCRQKQTRESGWKPWHDDYTLADLGLKAAARTV
jgi:hypothetical protein